VNATAQCPVCGTGTAPDARYCPTCGAALTSGSTANLAGGALFARVRSALVHEFDIAKEIGRGGMAAVYLAHDLQLGRKVALKVMLPELAFADEMPQRFLAEARTAAILDHPNIVPIFRAGESDGVRFFAMRYIDGCSLEQLVRALGQVPIGLACYILAEVAGALDFAHAEGVIHRDVKPGNVMLDRRWGHSIVTDFGIARVADSEHLTRTGMAVGTPAYMSPEQCMGEQPGSAADQYALGVVAYQLLTGETPFTGSAFVVQTAHLHEAPRPIRERRPDCPPELEAAVLRMLEKQAANRWPRLSHAVPSLLRHSQRSDAENQADLCRIIPIVAPPDANASVTPASPVPNGGSGTAPAASRGGASELFALPSFSAAPHGAGPGPVERVATLTVAPDVAQLVSGERMRLHATAAGAAGVVLAGEPVTWTSSAPEVADVDAQGEVLGVRPGTARIAAVCGTRSAVADVTVVPAPLTVASPVLPPPERTPRAETIAPAAPAEPPTLPPAAFVAAAGAPAPPTDLAGEGDAEAGDDEAGDQESGDEPPEPTIGQKLGITPSRPAPAPVPGVDPPPSRSRSRTLGVLAGVVTVAVAGFFAVRAFTPSDSPPAVAATPVPPTPTAPVVLPPPSVDSATGGLGGDTLTTVDSSAVPAVLPTPPVADSGAPPAPKVPVRLGIFLRAAARGGGVLQVGESETLYVNVDSGRTRMRANARDVRWSSSTPAVLRVSGNVMQAQSVGFATVSARVRGSTISRRFEVRPRPPEPVVTQERQPQAERAPGITSSDTALARAAVDDFVGRFQRSPEQALQVPAGASPESADFNRALLEWSRKSRSVRVQRRGLPTMTDQSPPIVTFNVAVIRKDGLFGEITAQTQFRGQLVHVGGGRWGLDNVVATRRFTEQK
jgi:serine/threonine protein kinase